MGTPSLSPSFSCLKPQTSLQEFLGPWKGLLFSVLTTGGFSVLTTGSCLSPKTERQRQRKSIPLGSSEQLPDSLFADSQQILQKHHSGLRDTQLSSVPMPQPT